MALRLNRIKASSNSSIAAEFTSALNTSINPSNIDIIPVLSSVLVPSIISLDILDNILIINTSPLTPKVKYVVTFKSSDSQKFVSSDGKQFLIEDSKTNKATIISISEPDDSVKAALKNYLKDNIYDLSNDTLVENIIDSQSVVLSKALNDIRQVKNDNFLEIPVIDEKKIRSAGAYDRLNQEGAFIVDRVSTTLTGFSKSRKINFESFPYDQISLQQLSSVSEEIDINQFNDFVINVAKGPVIKLTSLQFIYSNGNVFNYNPSIYGYQLLENAYDKDRCSVLYTLSDKQIKISDKLLEDGIILPKANDRIIITYDYKYLGRNIDDESVIVSEVIDIIREVCQPITNEFSLSFAPIVTELDDIATLSGVQFLDPRACVPFTKTHPAFIKEIPYRLESLPSFPGEYCVDYTSGKVFCYGAEINDGTGEYPPAATYKYRKIYTNQLDYNYNKDTDSLSAVESRNLAEKTASVSFNYEDVLVPGIDYVANVHKEILNERVDNRLLSLNSLTTKNYPITNAFKLYNETSGEIYTITRFDDYKIYFSYNKPPTIIDITRERAAVQEYINETLLVSTEFINANIIRVLKLDLKNINIVNSTEDSIGASFNTSVQFSNTNIFNKELYFDGQTSTEQIQINKISSVGQYLIDYMNGYVYVGVLNIQNEDIGTVNYKANLIKTANKHITSVSGLYNSVSTSNTVVNNIDYSNFTDTNIQPISWTRSDERFSSSDFERPYIYDNGTIYVTNDVKHIYGIYDLYDLNNNLDPINFGTNASYSNSTVIVSPVKVKESYSVLTGNTFTINHSSAGINIDSINSIISEDGYVYSGTVVGKVVTISGSSIVGQNVTIIYTASLNGSATPIVDYNRGDLFVDYSYVQDELIISYEYGDNCLDFRQASLLEEGDTYYVSYKVGALRDALLSNFGSMIDVPIINNFDTDFDREVYRDTLQGALQSFTNGPTKKSISTLIESITKTKPEITEAMFNLWSLGNSNLYQNRPTINGKVNLVAGKFDTGVLIEDSNSSLSYPVSSNFRLEEGTLEFWVVPNWDGIDNDATITFNNLNVLLSNIYIGSTSYHPDSSEFSLNRKDELSIGRPSALSNQNGLFIYYDKEDKRWYLSIRGSGTITGKVTTSGEFYDVKQILGTNTSGDIIRSITNEINFSLTASIDGYDHYSKLTFMSDERHYLFDFAEEDAKNRFSIYKDGSGYLNFEIFDKFKNEFKISKDISSWKAGEKHFIATSWKLNTKHTRDEIHLYVDGVEVPNMLRYGGRPIVTSGDRFRTIKPQIIVGTVSNIILRGIDLNTTIGSNMVSSDTINFQSAGIIVGNTIEILEVGFGTFTITGVSGNTLTLDSPSFTTLSDARFCVNPFTAIVSSDVELSNNITVSVINGSVETELPGKRADFPAYIIDRNALMQSYITVYGPAAVGSQIAIRTLGLNYRRSRNSCYLWSAQSLLKTQLPAPISLDDVNIIPIILPITSIGPSNSTLSSGRFISNPLVPTLVSNTTEGRRLSVRITGSNVNFSSPTTVTITGTSSGGTSEVISFSNATTLITTNKWRTITSIVVNTLPINTAINSVAIEVKEAFSVINPDGNNSFPIIRYSYIEKDGYGLNSNGAGLLEGGYFRDTDVDKMLVIESPLAAAGNYQILERFDDGSVIVNPIPTVFINGYYKLYNTTIGRSGFGNGYFKFEEAGSVNDPYVLPLGKYEFDYPCYLGIKFENINNSQMFIGSDYKSNRQSKCVIDELRILSRQISDIRVGETITASEKSVTTDYNRLVEFRPDKDTLFLCHFNNDSLMNEAYFWKMATREFLQSAESVNTNFGSSLVIDDRPFVVNNDGKLRTNKEGTIEFWISPNFDTFNDPVERYYFDATSAVVENQVSLTSNTVKLNGKTKDILSIRLDSDIYNNGINYFDGGSISKDSQTIILGQKLPAQKTKLKITYVPSGYIGNRISIYKDQYGFLVFNVHANEVDYQVSQPIFWSKYSWHKVLVTFKFNNVDGRDEIRLFVDGRESGVIRFGQCFLFGQGIVFGQGSCGDVSKLIANIDFNDLINEFYIGSTFDNIKLANARFDNIKISNLAKRIVTCAGMSVDESWQSNLNTVYPSIQDLYTTYLMNFDKLSYRNTDFTKLRNSQFGLFKFIINIFDSFDIIKDNSQLVQVINDLIIALKPAQSKVEINIE